MYYAKRDADGQVVSLHRDAQPGSEALSSGHPDVLRFLGLQNNPEETFAHMDASLVRVLEDLIDALIRRNVLCITDLPMEAQLKLFDRKHFREGHQSHSLDLYQPAQVQQAESGFMVPDWQDGSRK
jgi:hypothetical protein